MSTECRLVNPLNYKVMADVAVGIAVIATDIGRIADGSAFADVIVQRMRIHVVDREFKA